MASALIAILKKLELDGNKKEGYRRTGLRGTVKLLQEIH
jgi:hypothetical protein|tara:strand:- start:612 stop:728 length:117 start_codon:yes stop_codon:yes gene_type:complete